MAKPFFLQSLTLDNFMLHRHNTFDFSSQPIILITGANGSGKTQVLDALILCLGGHPNRLKKGLMSDLRGGFGPTASLDLVVANPKIGGKRAIQPLNKSLDIVDSDQFTIGVTIDETGALQYRLFNDKKHHKILKKDLRDLLTNLSLDAENRLAFTEEGTVNVFSDQSSRNKLDLLLETTGLGAYRDNIAATLDSISQATRALDPLRRKLTLEKEYLHTMQRTREMMEKQAAWIQKLKELKIEEAWSLVDPVSAELSDIEDKLEKKKHEYEQDAMRLRELETIQKQAQRALEKMDEQRRRVNDELDNAHNKLRRQEGENQSHERQLQNLTNKQSQLSQRLEELRTPMVVKELEQLAAELEYVQQEKERLGLIREKLGKQFFAPELAYERELLASSLTFYEALQKEGIACHGPLFREIEAKPEAPDSLWTALAGVMGWHLYSFVAETQPAFEKAISLWERLWPTETPLFAIVQVPAAKAKKWDKTGAPWDYLAAPQSVLYFLDEFLRAGFIQQVAEEPLWKAAKTADRNLFWQGRLYAPFPMAGGTWVSKILQSILTLTLEECSKALHAEELYQQMSDKEERLLQRRNALGGSQEQRDIEKKLQEYQEDAKGYRELLATGNLAMEELQHTISQRRSVRDEFAKKTDEIREAMAETEKKIERLDSNHSATEKAINHWDQAKEDAEKRFNDLTGKAMAIGDRPKEVRLTNVVAEERSHLEGQLQTLQIAPISQEDFVAQKDKVAKLDTELSGSSQHIQNLQVDVDKRFGEWHSEVAQRIQNISGSMGQLLTGVLQGIRLRVEDLKHPSQAGLHIEARRHTHKWHDLAHLSGGEKVLAIESLILSLHLQTDSPVHAIDELTQRLDMKFKAQAFEMVQNAVIELDRLSQGPFAPQFILLAPDTLGVEFPAKATKYFKHIVLAPAHLHKEETGTSAKVRQM